MGPLTASAPERWSSDRLTSREEEEQSRGASLTVTAKLEECWPQRSPPHPVPMDGKLPIGFPGGKSTCQATQTPRLCPITTGFTDERVSPLALLPQKNPNPPFPRLTKSSIHPALRLFRLFRVYCSIHQSIFLGQQPWETETGLELPLEVAAPRPAHSA